MNCSTCNKGAHRTSFGWLPALSGLSEKDAVAEQGPVLCTVCFPSAPVEWTEGQLNANGEYVAPKTYCSGSGTRNVKGEIGPPRGYSMTRYAVCADCETVVQFTNKVLRKHQPGKARERRVLIMQYRAEVEVSDGSPAGVVHERTALRHRG